MMTPSQTPTIIIDTREQDPFDFAALGGKSERAKLPIGDYSVKHLENIICVERKTIADLIHTIIHDRERFAREMKRRAKLREMIIVVEGSMENIMLHEYESDANPHSVLAACNAIQSYHRVPFNFCSTRQIACQWTFDFLARWARKMNNA
jgi:ERCC4-type nuclease